MTAKQVQRVAARDERFAPSGAGIAASPRRSIHVDRGGGRSAGSTAATRSPRCAWTTPPAGCWSRGPVPGGLDHGARLRGRFGRKLNAPWVWLPLCVLFLAPFVDRRRPFRLLHLDLLVLLAFGGRTCSSTAARSTPRCRWSTRCFCTCWPPAVAGCGRGRPPADPAVPDGLGRGRAGAAGGVPRGPELGRLERDRRRLRGRDRRRPDRGRRPSVRPGSATTSSAATPTGR